MGEQAAKYGRVNIATNSDGKYTSIPARDTWTLSSSPSYIHYCANETVHGWLHTQARAHTFSK